MKYQMICEKCGEDGRIRQPKQTHKNPDSIVPSSSDIVYLGMVVRCDKHLDDDMQWQFPLSPDTGIKKSSGVNLHTWKGGPE